MKLHAKRELICLVLAFAPGCGGPDSKTVEQTILQAYQNVTHYASKPIQFSVGQYKRNDLASVHSSRVGQFLAAPSALLEIQPRSHTYGIPGQDFVGVAFETQWSNRPVEISADDTFDNIIGEYQKTQPDFRPLSVVTYSVSATFAGESRSYQALAILSAPIHGENFRISFLDPYIPNLTDLAAEDRMLISEAKALYDAALPTIASGNTVGPEAACAASSIPTTVDPMETRTSNTDHVMSGYHAHYFTRSHSGSCSGPPNCQATATISAVSNNWGDYGPTQSGNPHFSSAASGDQDCTAPWTATAYAGFQLFVYEKGTSISGTLGVTADHKGPGGSAQISFKDKEGGIWTSDVTRSFTYSCT